jgi:hypothetical protein
MSAGRSWLKEFYVGFLLLVLTFLYLSHLNLDEVNAKLENKARAENSEMLIPAAVIDAEDFVTT